MGFQRPVNIVQGSTEHGAPPSPPPPPPDIIDKTWYFHAVVRIPEVKPFWLLIFSSSFLSSLTLLNRSVMHARHMVHLRPTAVKGTIWSLFVYLDY